MKILKQNKAITLIALVITIIVMLILVAVTITIAVNGGLFNYARKAGVDTNTRIAEEQEYANLESGKNYEYLIDKYTGKQDVRFCMNGADSSNENVWTTFKVGPNMKWSEWLLTDYTNELYSNIIECFGYDDAYFFVNEEENDYPEGAIVLYAEGDGESWIAGGIFKGDIGHRNYIYGNDYIDSAATYYFWES